MSEVRRIKLVSGFTESPLSKERETLYSEYILASDYDALRTQLSAAEARLVKAGEWMGHNGSCMGALLGKPDCDCGLQAFLEGL